MAITEKKLTVITKGGTELATGVNEAGADKVVKAYYKDILADPENIIFVKGPSGKTKVIDYRLEIKKSA